MVRCASCIPAWRTNYNSTPFVLQLVTASLLVLLHLVHVALHQARRRYS